MICPNCGKLISISEERCPFCGAWRPGMFGYGPALQRVVGNLEFPRLVTVACIVLYVAALALQPDAILGGGLGSLLSPGDRALYQLGMTGGPAWRNGWYWTVLTAIYLHGSLLHIFFNLYSLRNIGTPVLRAFGGARGFVLFTLSGAVGYLVSNVASGHPTVGASGSIYGLLAALIVYGRRRGIPEMTNQLWMWAVLMFALGFMPGSHVNNWAHAGGFGSGWLIAQRLPFSDERREGRGVQVLALVLVVATLAGFVLSFVKVTSLLMQG